MAGQDKASLITQQKLLCTIARISSPSEAQNLQCYIPYIEGASLRPDDDANKRHVSQGDVEQSRRARECEAEVLVVSPPKQMSVHVVSLV